MKLQEFFTHYPSRLLSVGVAVLGFFVILVGVSLLPILDQPNFPYPSKRVLGTEVAQPLDSPLSSDLQPHQLEFDISSIENRFLMSLCPLRPDDSNANPIAHIKINGSNHAKQVSLPGKIGLLFNDQGELVFQDDKERFWMEIFLKEDGSLFSSVFVECEGKVQKASFSRQPMEPSLQKAEALPSSEPFRALSGARWLGVDLVDQLDAGRVKQKIEIGESKLDISESEWIYWDGTRWVKAALAVEGNGKALAKIHGVSSQSLECDAWDETGEFHIRFAVPLQGITTPRVKIEEYFSSIRIRSDKQLSCLLEKQCLILREGDWIFKENNRWRVLRKPEEKRSLIQGQRSGDLIVLDSIDVKRKAIQGRFICSNRVQGFPLELAAASSKLERKTALSSPDRSPRTGRTP